VIPLRRKIIHVKLELMKVKWFLTMKRMLGESTIKEMVTSSFTLRRLRVSATFHMFEDSKIIEGSWVEDGAHEMWKIRFA
jgi:hypothetical protein